MGASPAEMVYGTLLVLLGQFCSLAVAPPATEPFLHHLRRAIENIRPVPTSAHCKAAAEHVPEGLQKCPMVWIRRDGYRQPLTPRYKGPFRVLGSHLKFFKVQLGEKQDTISIDRLKPATVSDCTEPARPRKRGRPAKNPAVAALEVEPAAQEPSHPWTTPQGDTTRSGCRIRQPIRLGIHSIGGPCSKPRSKLATQFNA